MTSVIQSIKDFFLPTRKERVRHFIYANSMEYFKNKYYDSSSNSEYSARVNDISRKYEGTAEIGNTITRNIIDVRAAFTINNGIKPVRNQSYEGDAEPEINFINQLMFQNKTSRDEVLRYATDAEIEGKSMIILKPNAREQKIELIHLPWTLIEYDIVPDENNYEVYKEAAYAEPKTKQVVRFSPEKFVYRKFGGRSFRVNSTFPMITSVIHLIENVDKALIDWRAINSLHSSPTPHLDYEESADIETMKNMIEDSDWDVGKILHTSGVKFNMVSADMQGTDSIAKEIETNIKMISGTTGVPVHFLGLPELLSNKNTGENLLELVMVSTNNPRNIWKSFWSEIFRKAMILSNQRFGTTFNPDAVVAEIPFVSTEKMKQLTSIYLPLYNAGIISLETFLSKVPDIEPKEEIDRMLEEASEGRVAEIRSLRQKSIGNEPQRVDPEDGTPQNTQEDEQ